MNSKLAGVNNFNDLLQAFLSAGISFQCAPRLKTERHHGKNNRIEKRPIGRIERAIDEDGGRSGRGMLPD